MNVTSRQARVAAASLIALQMAISPGVTAAQQASVTSSYTYDANGQLVSTATSGGASPTSIGYTYDAAGNRTSRGVFQAPTGSSSSTIVAFGSSNNPMPLNFTGAPSSVAVATQAAHGAANASGTSIVYSPASGFSGADSFTFTATNALGTSTPATVSITVNPQAPLANPVNAAVAYNSTNAPINLNLSGGAAASVSVAGRPSHGTATATGTSITYTPLNGYIGSDSFTYTATNVTGTSPAATVSVTVNPPPPYANAVSTTVSYNSSNDPVTLNITGISPATSVAVSTQATHGTARANGTTSITYTPNAGYSGPDSFYYTASNAGGTSSPAQASITVLGPAPTANPVSQTVAYNSSNNAITLNITGTAAASVAVSTQALHGTATASGTSITYTPTSGYSGADAFYYTATSAGGATSNPAQASITVNSANPPTAVNHSYSLYDNADPTVYSVLSGDSSPLHYSLTVIAVGTPQLGTATVTSGGGSITYTPNGTDGTDVFTYTISDGHGGSATATVTITVLSSSCPTC